MGLFGRSAQTVGFTREEIAAAYLRGEGLEVGALHLPLKLPAEARARYVDRMTVEELRRHYPELPDKRACFDRDRVTTSLEHVVKDYREGRRCRAGSTTWSGRAMSTSWWSRTSARR
jgi:hypothetical protein